MNPIAPITTCPTFWIFVVFPFIGAVKLIDVCLSSGPIGWLALAIILGVLAFIFKD